MTEPYAWVDIDSQLRSKQTSLQDIPLYTKQEWQGLTERDVKTITENSPSVEWAVLMTESTLKEKNGG